MAYHSIMEVRNLPPRSRVHVLKEIALMCSCRLSQIAVYLVRMGDAVGDQRDNHILTQLDADANMGAKTLLQRSKRGPFKRSSGRSRIMARTAHVSYRRRNGALEITVRRGITDSEMDTLIAKLGAHRLSTRSSFLYIIENKPQIRKQADRFREVTSWSRDRSEGRSR